MTLKSKNERVQHFMWNLKKLQSTKNHKSVHILFKTFCLISVSAPRRNRYSIWRLDSTKFWELKTKILTGQIKFLKLYF